MEKYLKEAVIPCSDAHLPTTYRCAGVRRVYGDLRPRGISFDCCSNSALANLLEPFHSVDHRGQGSGRVGEVNDATGVKVLQNTGTTRSHVRTNHVLNQLDHVRSNLRI